MTEQGAASETPLTIDILRGMPNDDELAALMAVVSEAYTSEAAAAVVEDEPTRSAWSLSQRGLREPLRRDWGWTRG
ncbi:acyl-CoA carboxylase subunit epsilon [Microbacterium sp. NPDC076911]|uniref:acyl-CoA carboxylase subunit epsilon n=1 Tax=Microbacterium sp. NPDC076911 TaxID=3154958 RepID=UPI003441AF84